MKTSANRLTSIDGWGDIQVIVDVPQISPVHDIDVAGCVTLRGGNTLPASLRDSLKVTLGTSSWGTARANLDAQGHFSFRNVRLEKNEPTCFYVSAGTEGHFARLEFYVTYDPEVLKQLLASIALPENKPS